MGGRGGSGARLNVSNAGGVRTIINGRETVYAVRNGRLQNLQSLQFVQTKQSAQTAMKNMVERGATLLSKNEIKKITSSKAKARKNRPDYELGNPFRERGKGKTVWRQKRGGR
jgi:hypothetical protein